MPGMEMPVRMTTAMLFFIVGGIAGYYATSQNVDIWWVVRSSFLFFVALGPVYWIQHLLTSLPSDTFINERGARELNYVESTEWGKKILWGATFIQIVLLVWGVWIASHAVFGPVSIGTP